MKYMSIRIPGNKKIYHPVFFKDRHEPKSTEYEEGIIPSPEYSGDGSTDRFLFTSF
jgi:hypothetical protein